MNIASHNLQTGAGSEAFRRKKEFNHGWTRMNTDGKTKALVLKITAKPRGRWSYFAERNPFIRVNLCPSAVKKSEGGFSRLDLSVLIAMVLIASAWLAYGRLGERGRMAHCASNLAALGKAMDGYVEDHGGNFPTAGTDVGKVQTTWDMDIFPYLKPGLAQADQAKLQNVVPRFFACPSDKLPHQGPARSYGMAANDMSPENWPPGPDSATGVGLWWNKATVTSILGEDALEKPEALPTIKRSNVPVPKDTVLLTDLISSQNVLSGKQLVAVFGTSYQRQFFKDGGAKFHQGKFNYLMVDGHVETLSPLQTGAFDTTAGIWSLKKGN